MRALAAAVCAGAAAWCSLGTLGLLGTPSGEARVALLPPLWVLAGLVGAAWVGVRLARLTPSQCGPLFGSSVAFLPWLPLPLPPAAYLGAGPLVALVWLMVGLGVVDARVRSIRSRWWTDVKRAPIVATLIAFLLYGASALWLAPILPDGDAPHYLIIAQSLIKDGDLQIENNHRNGDDLEYSLFAARPDFQQRGRNGAIYSIHAPGLPALVAPVYRLFGYPGTLVFLAAVAALTTGLVWLLGHRTTGCPAAAWFGWASCALTAPFFFQATQVFPDGIAATFVLLGMLPLVHSWRSDENRPGLAIWLISGTSLAVLPWLQTRLAILAVTIALCALSRLRSLRQAVAFAAVPVLSAIGWFGYFFVVYGTFDPSAPYGDNQQTTLANLVRGLPGLLFDQQFGLIPNAPVYGFILAGVVAGLLRNRRWSRDLSIVAAPYVVAVGMFYIWWGGASSPARLLAPLTMVLGVAAAEIWRASKTQASRVVGLTALGASVLVTAVLAGPDRGGLLMNERDGFALWLEWASGLLNLPAGAPSAFRDAPAQVLLKAATWIACSIAVWAVLRLIGLGARDRSSFQSGRFTWTATWGVWLALMTGFTLAWRIDRNQPLTPATAELGLIRAASRARPIAFDYRAARFETSDDVRMRARVRTEHRRRPSSGNALLFASRVPAGLYQVRALFAGPAEGSMTLRVGETPFPMWTASLSDARSEVVGDPIFLPLDVDSVLVEGDERARRKVSAVELSAVPSPVGAASAATHAGRARRAVPYGSVQAFFEDDLSYPEPSGFWVAGRHRARVLMSNFGARRELFLRNVPIANRVTIDIDGKLQHLDLGPREEKIIQLAPAGGPDALLTIETLAGIRPSQLDTPGGDLRYLGCWFEVRSVAGP